MSENILKELCSRLFNLFRQTETKEENTRSVACNRLRVVLMQDRTNLTPELLQRMRKELVELLSKYVEMDKDALELNFDQEGEQMALMLSIPVIRAKNEEEIEKALEQQDKKETEKTEETTDDSEKSADEKDESRENESEDVSDDEDEEFDESDDDESDSDDEDSDEEDISEDDEKNS